MLRRDPYEVFLIEGHTDAVGSYYSNQLLSERRAASLKRLLVNLPRTKHALLFLLCSFSAKSPLRSFVCDKRYNSSLPTPFPPSNFKFHVSHGKDRHPRGTVHVLDFREK